MNRAWKFMGATIALILVIAASVTALDGASDSAPPPQGPQAPDAAVAAPVDAAPSAQPPPTADGSASAPAAPQVIDARPSGLPRIDFRQFHQLLNEDDIPPIYNPVFVPADRARIEENELVIGVEINGLAKAYPITPLQFREMVNDELAGVPILVTW